jgi:transposase
MADATERMLAKVEARLGNRDFVSVCDAASALSVSVSVVYQWIDSGHVAAMNLGRGDRKARWTIERESIVEFARRRAAGGLN